jgi:hypothetical protein
VPDGSPPWMGSGRTLMNADLCFLEDLQSDSGGVQVECPSDIAFGISLLESCLKWFAVVGSCGVLISR